MKQIIYTLTVFLLLQGSAIAQKTTASAPDISGLTAKTDNKELSITWNATPDKDHLYWVVQGSEDGRHYSTLGLVMRPRSEGTKNYEFKNNLNSKQKRNKYYRVVLIKDNEWAFASNSVKA